MTDNQMPAGESTYYILYIGNPATGGIEVGKFVGKTNAINISPELYDILKDNTDEEFYVVKEVLYNDDILRSSAVRMPGQHFTVTETAFLFSEAGFNGDCVTVNKGAWSGQRVDLNQTGYEFDNKLSSMLVQGNVYVSLFADSNSIKNAQRVFTDENGFAHIRDFNEMIIGPNTVSSVTVDEKEEGIYMFQGPDFTGYKARLIGAGVSSHNGGHWTNENSLSSVKIVGPYAVALYDNQNYSGQHILIKEDYGNGNLGSMDNKTSSYRMIYGEGVWLFDGINFTGSHQRFTTNSIFNCNWTPDCGFANDTLSSVLVIGDYGIGMFLHSNYRGFMYPTRHHISNMENSSSLLGDNSMSSFRVFPKGVYLGENNHLIPGGTEKIVTTPGEYRTIEHLGIKDNTLSAMFVIGDYNVTLFSDLIFKGGKTEAGDGWYDGHLGNQVVGENNASSIIIEEN
ncbi:hypothetical protein ERL59_18935 [Chengkuizengella sp. YPA3-1-1]|uniref:Beta/gamma crystallin 'Greek key' domain-containing protein n=1 Tax=Chengkuizengella marina TaxID=2507566 RepID=A0A6N9Q829_9BACL|nr:hypothetical protein [Chengkuizengella marina]